MAVTGGWTVGGVGTSDNAIAAACGRASSPLGTSTGTLPPAPRGAGVSETMARERRARRVDDGPEGFGSGRGDPLEAMVRPEARSLQRTRRRRRQSGTSPARARPVARSRLDVLGDGAGHEPACAIDEADVDGPNSTDPGKSDAHVAGVL